MARSKNPVGRPKRQNPPRFGRFCGLCCDLSWQVKGDNCEACGLKAALEVVELPIPFAPSNLATVIGDTDEEYIDCYPYS